jgi:hypothetical protein
MGMTKYNRNTTYLNKITDEKFLCEHGRRAADVKTSLGLHSLYGVTVQKFAERTVFERVKTRKNTGTLCIGTHADVAAIIFLLSFFYHSKKPVNSLIKTQEKRPSFQVTFDHIFVQSSVMLGNCQKTDFPGRGRVIKI